MYTGTPTAATDTTAIGTHLIKGLLHEHEEPVVQVAHVAAAIEHSRCLPPAHLHHACSHGRCRIGSGSTPGMALGGFTLCPQWLQHSHQAYAHISRCFHLNPCLLSLKRKCKSNALENRNPNSSTQLLPAMFCGPAEQTRTQPSPPPSLRPPAHPQTHARCCSTAPACLLP